MRSSHRSQFSSPSKPKKLDAGVEAASALPPIAAREAEIVAIWRHLPPDSAYRARLLTDLGQRALVAVAALDGGAGATTPAEMTQIWRLLARAGRQLLAATLAERDRGLAEGGARATG